MSDIKAYRMGERHDNLGSALTVARFLGISAIDLARSLNVNQAAITIAVKRYEGDPNYKSRSGMSPTDERLRIIRRLINRRIKKAKKMVRDLDIILGDTVKTEGSGDEQELHPS